MIEAALTELRAGRPARRVSSATSSVPLFDQLQLLTAKPVLYVCNVEESAAAEGNAWSAKVAERAKQEGAASVVISAAIESEVAQLSDPAEKADYLGTLGLEEPGLVPSHPAPAIVC